MTTDPSARVALITGANKGIGFAVGRGLGEAGASVLLGCRDVARGQEAAGKLREDGIDAHSIVLDVTDPATIAAAVANIERDYGRLDVLVNNAGTIYFQTDGPPSRTEPEDLRRVMDVNFFGAVLVTQAMMPLLRKSRAPRVVSVSSTLGSLTKNLDPQWSAPHFQNLGYNASKAALNMMTVQVANELQDIGGKANAMCPGQTATNVNGHTGHPPAVGAAEAVRLALLPAAGPTGMFYGHTGEELPW